MDWIAIGTLGASIVAAVGAVWAVVVSQMQLNLARREADLPLPVIQAELLGAITGLPDWTLIRIEIRNRAPIAAEALSVRVAKPTGLKLVSERDIYDTGTDAPWIPVIRKVLPEAVDRLSLEGMIEPAGSSQSGGRRDWNFFDVCAQCPPSTLESEPTPRLTFEMRWRDHTTRTFEIAVNVIKPRKA